MFPTFAFFMLILYVAVSSSQASNFLTIYAKGSYQIVVRDIATKKELKTFYIQYERPTGGLCICWEKDLLFYAYEDQFRMIHMEDDQGKPLQTGTGELFTNPDKDHQEDGSILGGRIISIAYHKKTKKVYAFTLLGVHIIDVYKHKRKFQISNFAPLENATRVMIHQDSAIVQFKNGIIHPVKLNQMALTKINFHSWSYPSVMNTFAINPVNDTFFFTEKGNMLRVRIIVNKSSSREHSLFSNALFTRDIGSFAVNGKTIVWESKRTNQMGQIFIGTLNDNNESMSKRNVVRVEKDVIFGSDNKGQNIIIVDARSL